MNKEVIEIIIGVLFFILTLFACSYFTCLYCKSKTEEKFLYEKKTSYSKMQDELIA